MWRMWEVALYVQQAEVEKGYRNKAEPIQQRLFYSCGTVLQDIVPYDQQYNDVITNIQ